MAQIENILQRNKIIESLNFIITMMLFTLLATIFLVDSNTLQVMIMIVFFGGMGIFIIFGPETTPLKFSEVLTHYLTNLSNFIHEHHQTNDEVEKKGKKLIKKLNEMIEEYIADARSREFLVFGFDSSERVLRRLQKSLLKTYSYFNYYEENQKHKKLLKKNYKEICNLLKDERKFLKMEEKILDQLEKIPIIAEELQNDKQVYLKILFKKYISYKIIIFMFGLGFVIWKIIPELFPGELSLENQILVTITLIGTALIRNLFSSDKF